MRAELEEFSNRGDRECPCFRIEQYRVGVLFEQLKHLEHIVDVTDTGIARREEMGINNAVFDGFSWLLKEDDRLGAVISRWVENNYKEILNDPKSAKRVCTILLSLLKQNYKL